jgi:hypothetical protein
VTVKCAKSNQERRLEILPFGGTLKATWPALFKAEIPDISHIYCDKDETLDPVDNKSRLHEGE